MEKQKEWIVIRTGIKMPDDFCINGFTINVDKYVVETGDESAGCWCSELEYQPTIEMIGATISGSKAYKDFRYRERDKQDLIFDVKKTAIGRICNISLFSKK